MIFITVSRAIFRQLFPGFPVLVNSYARGIGALRFQKCCFSPVTREVLPVVCIERRRYESCSCGAEGSAIWGSARYTYNPLVHLQRAAHDAMEEVVSVRVVVAAGEKLGLGLAGNQTVMQIGEDSVLAGKVNLGDSVLSINGQDLQKLSGEQLVEYMSQLQGDILLVVKRVARFAAPPDIRVDLTPEQRRRKMMRRTGAVSQGPGGAREESQPHTMVHKPPAQPELKKPEHKRPMHLKSPLESIGKRLSFTPEREHPARKPFPMQPSKTIDFGDLPQWRARPVITLHNYSSGEQTVDKLHTQGMQVSVWEASYS